MKKPSGFFISKGDEMVLAAGLWIVRADLQVLLVKLAWLC